MPSVLMLTEPADIHGAALQWTMRKRGFRFDQWHMSEMPTEQRLSLRISSDACSAPRIVTRGTSMEDHRYSTVWARRIINPPQNTNIHVADRVMAQTQCERFVDSLRHFIAQDVVWLNPVESRDRARQKPLQLAVARSVGFRIPETLISNDPAEIRAFWREQNSQIIYKPLAPAFWLNRNSGKRYVLLTSKLSAESLEDDQTLQVCPGIYQNLVAKRSELRVVVFGSQCIAVRIHSQETTNSSLDWRADFTQKCPLEHVQLPDNIENLCLAFMRKMNLLHGSIDLIESPDGSVTFLEVNEMGQFLWIEHRLPEMRLLELAAQFSLAPSSDFQRSSDLPSFDGFLDYLKTDAYLAFENELVRLMASDAPSGFCYQE
jgi:glutathione synthase/RimK-type ligase-like ATP-grasp enzyme